MVDLVLDTQLSNTDNSCAAFGCTLPSGLCHALGFSSPAALLRARTPPSVMKLKPAETGADVNHLENCSSPLACKLCVSSDV